MKPFSLIVIYFLASFFNLTAQKNQLPDILVKPGSPTLYSSDNGTTWKPREELGLASFPFTHFDPDRAFSFDSLNKVCAGYVSSYSGFSFLMHSSDAGITWKPAYHSGQLRFFPLDVNKESWIQQKINPRNEKNGFICGLASSKGPVFLETTDAGRSWHSRLIPGPNCFPAEVKFENPATGKISFSQFPYSWLITTDGGTTWNPSHGDLSTASVARVETKSENEFRILNTCVAQYRNSASAEWKNSRFHGVNDPYFLRIRSNSVYFISANEGLLLEESGIQSGSAFIIFRTTDGGANWYPAKQPSQKVPKPGWTCQNNLNARIHQSDENKLSILLGTGDNNNALLFMLSEDRGKSWRIAQTDFVYGTGCVNNLQYSDKWNGTVQYTTGIEWITNDGGFTWKQKSHPISDSTKVTAIARLNEQKYFRVFENKLLQVSEDGGTTWTNIDPVNEVLQKPGVSGYFPRNSLHFFDEMNGFLFVQADRYYPPTRHGFWLHFNYLIFATTDGGKTWKKALEKKQVPADWAEMVNDTGVLIHLSSGKNAFVPIGINPGKTFLFATTTDKGKKWKLSEVPVPSFSHEEALSLKFQTELTGELSDKNSRLVTDDGGVTWK